MKITIITVSSAAIKVLIDETKKINNGHNHILDLKLFYAARQMSEKRIEDMLLSIDASDMTMIDLMGTPSNITKQIYSAFDKCKGNIVPLGGNGRNYLRLGKITNKSMSMMKKGNKKVDQSAMKKMAQMAEMMGKMMPNSMAGDMKNLSQISKYFRLADTTNIKNMLYLILRDYGAYNFLPEPLPAREIEEVGICDPEDKIYYKNPKEYIEKCEFDINKPTVAIFYYGHTYPNDTSVCVKGIAYRIKKFTNILPIAFCGTSSNKMGDVCKWLENVGGKKVDLIINFMSFRLSAGPMGGDAQKAVNMLERINVPYMHPFFMSKRREIEWLDSIQGINSSEFMISVMLPEFDGCIETFPIGAMCEPTYNEEFNIDTRELKLIEDRVDRLVEKVRKRLNLSFKSNEEKKVAIICYNYPPGEDNLFGGAFLDTFVSIENILSHLKKEGFKTNDYKSKELMDRFLNNNIINSPRYSDDTTDLIKYRAYEYKKEIKDAYFKDELIEQWGSVPGNVMADQDKNFYIPGIINENIFIGLQPSRGVHENQEKVYHDKTLLPHHQYIAFYKWLRDEFKADAIIHVGTHGTLEFLKGKECGMSSRCFPDLLIADIPHFYLYYAGNPSEAMIAKRRSHAELIGYQPPEFIQGELYGEYADLSALIDEYRESLRVSPVRSKRLIENIEKKAKENNLSSDLDEVEKELYRMNRSLIPKGLHVFGRGYSKDEAKSYIKGLLRYDRGEIKSLQRIIAENKEIDYDYELKKSHTEILAELDNSAEKIADEYFDKGNINGIKYLKNAHKKECQKTLNFGKNIYDKCMVNTEINGLIRGLTGQYNPAKLAGDIFRNPEVMPTGYNLYQFDPRFVPSETAYQRGKQIVDNTLNKYKEETGELPASTAVILWGLETSRTCGETVSQILAYLGVRVVRGMNVWEPKYEIIPIEELGRKRIDVVINICGFFRDMFPNIIESLNKVFLELSILDENDEMNCFKANCKKIYEELIKQGYDEKEAEELSHSRIFGPKEGAYGTGITKIIETKNWEKEETLGEEFVKSLRYVYSKNYRGKDVDGLLNANLKCVDIVSQIRSNHEYEITDLDHYYEFFGGLAKSVELAKGSKAKMYITDTTNEYIETESVEKSINRGIRTRLLNPKWIDGMLEHDYHGVQKIYDRFENVMGLAASTNSVEEWIYNDMHDVYIKDEKMRERLKENNPYAYMSIVEQMMEYHKRGYWNASQEQVDKLTEVFLELEGDIEGR